MYPAAKRFLGKPPENELILFLSHHRMKKKGKKMAEQLTLTPYDEATQTKRLQVLKTFVPYAQRSVQRPLVAMIQILEYQTAIDVLNQGDNQLSACSVPEGGNKNTALLTELKQFCSTGEQEMIDNLLNLMSILDNYELL
jgi:hypothetical protein